MTLYSWSLELLLYGAAIFFLVKKKELAVIYLPFLFYTRELIEEPVIRAVIWYLIVLLFFGLAASRVNLFRCLNLFAVILWGYLTSLFILSGNMADTRANYFAISCLLFACIIVPNLFIKERRETIANEVNLMATLVISIFILNALISTLAGYNPNPMYGRTTGVLYGNTGANGFMLIPLVLFVYMTYNLRNPSIFRLLIALLALGLVLLSLRRTACLVAIVALVAFLYILARQENAKQVAVVGGATLGILVVSVLFTGFREQFLERYDARFEDDALIEADAGRFTDHVMVYEDIFVHDRYSSLFGYGFFDSPGNYGGGVHGSRTLHPDMPVIVHASGIIGLALYLGTWVTVFRNSYASIGGAYDRGLFLFCFATFVVFTTSGRITETSYAIGMILLLYIPVCRSKNVEN